MLAEVVLPADEAAFASKSRPLATAVSGQNVGRVGIVVGRGSEPRGCIPARIHEEIQPVRGVVGSLLL